MSKALTTTQNPSKPRPQTPDWINAYAAGYLDGEGSICIYRNKHNRSFKVYVEVTSTDVVSVEFMCNNFGGNIRKRKGVGNRKDTYHWRICSLQNCYAFVLLVYPYLLIKKSQAEVLVNFVEGFPGYIRGYHNRCILSDEEYARRGSLADKILLLKKEVA